MVEGGTITYVAKVPMCDFCQFREAVYDAKAKQGPWAFMCEECFKLHGVGLGIGMGQKLKLRDPFLNCLDVKKGSFGEKVKECSLKTVTMTESDLESAVTDSLWYPTCPYCGASTGAEPDASYIYCDACSRRFKIINPYF